MSSKPEGTAASTASGTTTSQGRGSGGGRGRGRGGRGGRGGKGRGSSQGRGQQNSDSSRGTSTTNAPKFKGDIEELGHNVFVLGGTSAAEVNTKTLDRIGDCAAIKLKYYGSDMKALLKNNIEAPMTEPPHPTPTGSSSGITKAQEHRWNKEMDQHMNRELHYIENEQKLFIIIMGQCSMALRNKLESHAD